MVIDSRIEATNFEHYNLSLAFKKFCCCAYLILLKKKILHPDKMQAKLPLNSMFTINFTRLHK